MIRDFIDDNTFQELNVVKSTKTTMLSSVTGNKNHKSANAVIVGSASIGKMKILCIYFDKTYKMGTIGVSEGEKIALAFEYATKKKSPIVAVVASGGIRVQESTPALMQMVKITSAVKQHSDKGLLFISIVTNPTLGGASASFVSLADIIIAEKGATYGFSGKRIIEDTTHERLPDDFQTAEYAKRYGMVDIVADKDEIKALIGKFLRIHTR
jgi:acetyl-CoA carboxylase carboxyl transferase subunit beta